MKAGKQLARALEINVRIQHPLQQCLSLDALSQLYCSLGEYCAAFDYFRRALAVYDDERAPHRVRALANGCLLYHLMDDNLSALEIGEKALALSQTLPQIKATALTNLGHTLAGLRDFDTAAEKYHQALDLRSELVQPHLGIEAQAGLARLDLELGFDQLALAHIEKILLHLEDGPLVGPDQPMLVYLTCYRVLRAVQDTRSEEILKVAYDDLHVRAAMIEDTAQRKSYLKYVKANREIIFLFEQK